MRLDPMTTGLFSVIIFPVHAGLSYMFSEEPVSKTIYKVGMAGGVAFSGFIISKDLFNFATGNDCNQSCSNNQANFDKLRKICNKCSESIKNKVSKFRN
jgi:hypothetical protein